MKQSQLQNHEGKAENSRLGNTPPPSNYSHDQCFTWNINWSFKLSHTSKPQNPTNTSKQIISIPTPSRFTWNTKPQQPIGERQRTLNAISCNSTIRSCFTWNHSSIFRTQQTYVSRETSGKHKNKTDFQQFNIHPYKHAPHIPQNKLYDFKLVERHQHFLQNRTVVAEDSIYKHYQCFTWNAPHMISLWTLRTTKIDGMFFLIFHLLG